MSQLVKDRHKYDFSVHYFTKSDYFAHHSPQERASNDPRQQKWRACFN
jgi:hypothetical protein